MIARERTGRGPAHRPCAVRLDDRDARQPGDELSGVRPVAPRRMGNAHVNLAPYQTLPVADGWLIVAVGNDGQFARLCGVLGLEGLARDPRFATNPGRVTNRVEMDRELTAKTCVMEARRSSRRARKGGRARPDRSTRSPICSTIRSSRRAACGSSRRGRPGLRSPILMSDSPLALDRRSPRLGEHQAEILREIGLERELTARLDGARARAANRSTSNMKRRFETFASIAGRATAPTRGSARRRRNSGGRSRPEASASSTAAAAKG